jgi:hypothetical protein
MSKSRTTVGELETIRRSNVHTSRVFNFETVNFNSGNAIKVQNLFLENYVHSDEKKSSKHLTRVVSFNPQKGKISRTDTEKPKVREVKLCQSGAEKAGKEEELNSVADSITVQGMKLLRELRPTSNWLSQNGQKEPPSAGTQTSNMRVRGSD